MPSDPPDELVALANEWDDENPDDVQHLLNFVRAAHDAGLIVYVENEDRDVQGIALRLEDERDALKAENEQLREILRIKGWFDPSFS